jgi:hypothetical protein
MTSNITPFHSHEQLLAAPPLIPKFLYWESRKTYGCPITVLGHDRILDPRLRLSPHTSGREQVGIKSCSDSVFARSFIPKQSLFFSCVRLLIPLRFLSGFLAMRHEILVVLVLIPRSLLYSYSFDKGLIGSLRQINFEYSLIGRKSANLDIFLRLNFPYYQIPFV